MKNIQVPKSKFKPKVFEFLRDVESGETEICITDHGQPVAKVISIHEDEEAELKSMQGLVTKYVDPCEPVDVQWEAVS